MRQIVRKLCSAVLVLAFLISFAGKITDIRYA